MTSKKQATKLQKLSGAMGKDMTDEVAFLKDGDGRPNTLEPQKHGSPLSTLNAVVSRPVKRAGSDGPKDDNGDDDHEEYKRTILYGNVVGLDKAFQRVILASRCGVASCM